MQGDDLLGINQPSGPRRPINIISDWIQLSQSQDWNPEQRDYFQRFIETTQPPLYFNEAEKIAVIFDAIYPTDCASLSAADRLLKDLDSLIQHHSVKSDRIISSYPLYACSLNLYKEIERNSDAEELIGSFWGITSDLVTDITTIDAKTWSEDVNALSSAILSVYKRFDVLCLDASDLSNQLARYKDKSDRSSQASLLGRPDLNSVYAKGGELNDIKRASQLLQRDRIIGVNQKHIEPKITTRASGKKNSRDKRHNVSNDLEAILNNTAAITSDFNNTQDLLEKLENRPRRQRGSNRRQQLRSKQTYEAEFADVQLDSDTLPNLPGKEIRAAIRRSQGPRASQNIASLADPTKFPFAYLLHWLNRITREDAISGIACLMLWSVGISVERLVNLTTDLKAELNESNCSLNLKTGVFSYRVKGFELELADDESGENNSIPNHILSVVVPLEWTEKLTELHSRTPFADIKQRYKGLMKIIDQSALTRAPRLIDWAGSVLSFEQGALAASYSALKSGALPFRYRVSAIYNAFDILHLRRTYKRSLNALLDEWAALENSSAGLLAASKPWNYSKASSSKTLGSGVAGRLNEWQEMYSMLLREHSARNTKILGLQLSPNLDDLISVWNLNQVLAVWLYQFYTVGRRLGDSSESIVVNGILWHRDKNSKDYEERKQFPLRWSNDTDLHSLEKQQQNISRATHLLRSMLQYQGVDLKDMRHVTGARQLTVSQSRLAADHYDVLRCAQTREHLPSFLRFNKATGEAELQLMSESAMREVLNAYPALKCFSKLPLNLFRHVIETEASKKFGQNLTDLLLGHNHPGSDLFGYCSSLTREDLEEVTMFLNDLGETLSLCDHPLSDVLFSRGFMEPR